MEKPANEERWRVEASIEIGFDSENSNNANIGNFINQIEQLIRKAMEKSRLKNIDIHCSRFNASKMDGAVNLLIEKEGK